jgi:hypothetical protein
LNKDAASQLGSAIEDLTNESMMKYGPNILVFIGGSCLLLPQRPGTYATSPEKCLTSHGMIILLVTKVSMGAGYGWWRDICQTAMNLCAIKTMNDAG